MKTYTNQLPPDFSSWKDLAAYAFSKGDLMPSAVSNEFIGLAGENEQYIIYKSFLSDELDKEPDSAEWQLSDETFTGHALCSFLNGKGVTHMRVRTSPLLTENSAVYSLALFRLYISHTAQILLGEHDIYDEVFYNLTVRFDTSW